MRPFLSSVVCLLALSALCLPCAAAAPPVDAKAIDAAVRRSLEVWHVPGAAVGIVRDGEVVYLKGHGTREVGGKDAVTPDTFFPIASCTKAFTTVAMAALVDDGKMGWDDPVRKHVPFFRLSDPLADANVTLRDLVCHRTGLAGHDLLWYHAPWSVEEIVRRAGRLPLDRPFRTTFQYQSAMFMAAGLAVQSAAGEPWEQFVQKRLLDPLEMKATVFTSTAALRSADCASPHRVNAQGQTEVMPRYPLKAPDPAGSVHSSARDLCRWLHFHLDEGRAGERRLVSAKELGQTHTPQMVIGLDRRARALWPDTVQMSYGMAWVIQDHRGHKLVSHSGAIDGFRAHLTMVPEKRLGIVILGNLHHTRMNLALSNTLLDLLLDLPRKDWDRLIREVMLQGEREEAEKARARQERRHHGTRPSREAAAYAGDYEHPAYGTAHVSLDRGRLVWRWNNFAGPLEHFHYDTFVLPDAVLGEPHVVFTLGEDGGVASMKVLGHLNAEFRRVKRKK
jgi:CubicO group peptidase (beta-lactamase class C family)